MNITRALVENGQVSFTLANTTEIVKTAVKLHALAPASTLAFGKALCAMTFMSACLKRETGEISLSVQGDGLGGNICVSGNYKLHLRGYINNPTLKTQSENEILGAGSLTIIRDDGYNRPFVGTCALPELGGVDGAFEEYFRVSEQLPTRIKTVVELDEKGEVAFAGVACLQPLPFADNDALENTANADLERFVSALKTMDTQTAVNTLFTDCTALETRTASYQCNCSKAYLSRVIVALGEKEIRDIVREEGSVKVHCHYCNTDYEFADKDIDELFNKDKK